jgi:hypothetical protein
MLQLGHHSYRPPWGTLGSTAVATAACLPTRAISADSGGARWTDEEEVIGLDFGMARVGISRDAHATRSSHDELAKRIPTRSC